ncbi:hypothetical protein U3728_001754 [Salmonella enterica]|nr:hypothetical protein [Salmonella enterica]EDX7761144.1 hypothetical protein [Salmonella enterica subsp. enterica serovar Thompson]EEN0916810.1 hypothetical protein [Salmonella enterica]ELS4692714.1 hypothetical protein [Salmonella enterica]EMA6573193.1 hypothetical protein [Salmonella enterica]
MSVKVVLDITHIKGELDVKHEADFAGAICGCEVAFAAAVITDIMAVAKRINQELKDEAASAFAEHVHSGGVH